VKLKETLHCEVCSSTWSRKKIRGRKPKVCPQCIKDEVTIYEQVTFMPDQSSSKKTAKKWICPQCQSSVTVFINLEYPPVCRNPQSHSTRSVEMQINGRKAQVA
jgi:rubrerythrin